MIPGGYIIEARQIQDSEISHAPPHVREIWGWMIRRANHKDYAKNGTVLRRGQLVCTYRDIRDGLHWMVGYRKETYTKWQCEMAMKWLTKRQMIATTKTTRGMLITVCNYDLYQTPENYERHSDDHKKATRKPQTPDTINKNGGKNDKEEEIPPFEDFEKYAVSQKPKVCIEALRLKYESWVVNGWKDGNGKKIVNWKSKLLNTLPYIEENKQSWSVQQNDQSNFET